MFVPESIPGWNVVEGAGDSAMGLGAGDSMGLGAAGGDVVEPPEPLVESPELVEPGLLAPELPGLEPVEPGLLEDEAPALALEESEGGAAVCLRIRRRAVLALPTPAPRASRRAS